MSEPWEDFGGAATAEPAEGSGPTEEGPWNEFAKPAAEEPWKEFQPKVYDRSIPVMREAQPESTLHKVVRVGREALSPLIGPTDEEKLRDASGIDANGQPIYKPAGSAVDREGLIPALSHPMVPIPRAPTEDLGPVSAMNALPYAASAAWNQVVAPLAEFAESPLGIATGGVAKLGNPVLNRVVAGGFAADVGRHTPEAARAAGAASVDGTTPEQIQADTALGATVLGSAAMAGHAAARNSKVQLPTPREVSKAKIPEILSEFGGEEDAAATAPEKAETLAAQVELVKQGKRAAVLFTPGTDDALTETPKGLESHPTTAGVFVYDPKQTSPELIDAAVRDDAIGELLGYGIPRKPAPGTEAGVVTLRGADGTEKQAVVSDRQSVGSVVAAAGSVAAPGDRVAIESAEDVLAGRAENPTANAQQSKRVGGSAIAADGLRTAIRDRGDVPAKLFEEYNASAKNPMVLPDGYSLAGDKYVFTEPDVKLTPEQLASREAVQAAAELRTQRGDDGDARSASLPSEAARRTEIGEEGAPVDIGERPPDIIDYIEGNHSGRIKVSSKEDFGDYLKNATGWAREHLSASRGEKADAIIQGMHAEGMYPRIESEGDLLEAVHRASENRKAWNERRRAAAPDKVEAWFNRAIEATGTVSMDTPFEGVTGALVWLPKEGARAALIVAKGVYIGTRNLARAIAAGIEHVRELNLPGFNEGELKTWFAGALGERSTGQKVQDSSAVSEDVKAGISQYLYERRTNATDEDLARGILNKVGLDGAERVLRNPPAQMAGATVSKLLGEVTRTLAEQERQARAAGDSATAGKLAERSAALWDEMLPRITDMAQGLQALNDLVDLSPDAQVARLKNRLEKAAAEAMAAKGPETEVMRGALEQGRQAAVEGVKNDPRVNEAARGAVDANVAGSAETKRGVLMELASEWAESSVVLEHARAMVRSRVGDLLKGKPPSLGASAVENLKTMLDDFAKRAANIFAAHVQGAEVGKSVVDKLVERLGISKEAGEGLSKRMWAEWERQLKAANAKVPKRIATMRATRARQAGELPTAPTSAVDASIRRQLKDLNLKLGEVLRQETARRDATGEHVAERVVKASGLTGEEADTLRNVFKNRWETMVTEGQRRALENLQKASGVKLSKPMQSAFEKLSGLERMGALTSERFYDVVKEQLKLKQLTPADARVLRAVVQRAKSMPEGFMRQQEAGEVLKLTEKLSGNATLKDLPLAIFFSNILSGLTTHAKIVLENVNLLAGQTLAATIARPAGLLHPVGLVKSLTSAYGRGLVKGALQAAGTLKSGQVTGVWKEVRTPGILEMKPFGERLEPLNFWKWATRAISVDHEVTFKPAWELRQMMTARDVATREGLSGKALDQRVANLLANTEEHVTAARTQALSDLQAAGNVSKIDLARRTREILEQQREVNMPGSTESAREYALRSAYLNEPYGFLGLIAKGVRATIEKARQEYPILGTGAKTQIPFTTIVANILNEKLNWTPVGLGRAAMSQRSGNLYGRPVLPGERAELYAKAVVGTVLLGAMAELFGDHIHGNGPSDPRKRKQLQAAGWIPHSIEWKGRFYTYMNTPAGVGLAVIGNLKDWHRYGHGEDADSVSRTAFALKATINAIVSQGMLDSLKRVFESVGNESTSEGADKLQKQALRTASSFVVPNLVNQVDKIFDPTVFDQTGMEAMVKSQIPFVRHGLKPALTVLGDPVESGPFHYWTSRLSTDPLLRTLAEKQAWIPEPSRNQIIGDKKRGPDYYRAMTAEEYYQFIRISGPEIREKLENKLDEIEGMDTEQAQAFVRKVAEAEHIKAKKGFE